MTDHKLSEQELQEIREEAEKYYPVCNRRVPDVQTMSGFFTIDSNAFQRNICIDTLTRERERVKELIDGLEGICKNFGKLTLTEIQRIATNSLNNYKNNK